MKSLFIACGLLAVLAAVFASVSAESCPSRNQSIVAGCQDNTDEFLRRLVQMRKVYLEAEAKAIGNSSSIDCFMFNKHRWDLYVRRHFENYPNVKPFIRVPCPFDADADSCDLSKFVKVELPAYWI
ncbi:protein US6C [Cercopithecine betaherpesvirus 5]|uniref:Protein US6C n=1 Tax=Simian cytomegalovirus (strain Colburn) TaxID=50292 RepID=G8XTL5_SCMVC|nr:protein US6C [Cercopithecine betaherpesvirus 5]AEV80507.1 protein US6C [Cercopithecine betaherpesvirus 5]